MKAIEEEGGSFVARLKLETELTGEALENLKASVESEIKASYELQLAVAHGEIKALQWSLEQTLTMGSNQINQTFNAPVGNVAGTNYGQMTATISQNASDINQIIDSLRQAVRAFPEEPRDDALIELDDLESDLQTPEKQEPKRLGRRLKRLMAAGATAAALTATGADITSNLNDFTGHVLELGEKIGLSAQDLQLDQNQP